MTSVNKAEIQAIIERTLNQILEAKGRARVALTEDMLLLDEEALPIDSLDLAQIVLDLQSLTGRDPFEAGFIEFRTAGELASLFSS
jgi:acyl carrier protein